MRGGGVKRNGHQKKTEEPSTNTGMKLNQSPDRISTETIKR